MQFDRGEVPANEYLNNVDITEVPEAVRNAMYAGDGDTNSIDPNYEIPSDWIARVGVDYQFDIPGLGNNFNATAEVMRKWMTDNSQWKDISRCVSGETAAGVSIYEPCDPDAPIGHYDLQLTNEDKNGKAWIYTASLSKQWDNGFNAYAAYTHQNIDEGNPGTSSTATSNYEYNIVVDRNQPLIGTADYETEHTLKIALGYSHEFFDGYASKFNLFFQRRSGTPFSHTMNLYCNRRNNDCDDDFGDQDTFVTGSYLPYIPAGANDANISPESTISYDDMMAIFESVDLAQYAGGFAPKGARRAPWVNTLDFQFQQELPGLMDGHKGVFYVSINNLLNLIDSSKGKSLRMNYTNNSIIDFNGLDDEGRYIYGAPYGGADTRNWDTFEAEESTWRIKMGVQYKF